MGLDQTGLAWGGLGSRVSTMAAGNTQVHTCMA